MLAWLDKIKQGFTWSYQGGVHPATHKQNINCGKPKTLAPPRHVVIPVQQHIGSAGKLVVEPGQRVKKGQALTQSQFFQAPPVHASLAGTIVTIEPRVSAHPSALPELSVVIEVDQQQQDCAYLKPLTEQELTPELICQRVHQAGITGMGGAGFPTALKITPNKPLDVLIINGAECEPYITADDCLMRNYAEELLRGVSLLQTALQPKLTIIAVEDDKPEALKALREASDETVIVRNIPTKYPSGGEKQLIQILTGKEVGAKQLPIDMGILVHNVGTAYAIHRAVDHGEPLISRIVTLAGKRLSQAANYWMSIGTSVADIIDEQAAHASEGPVIMGGSMMGFMLPSTQAPVIKTTNCLILNKPQPAVQESPCIRCGECAQACPMGLLPQQLYWFAKGDELNKAREYKIMDCIECGACAFVCPSNISLVEYYRTAKAKIKSEDQAKQEAELAKQRFDARQARLEKDKAERKAKHQEAALRRQSQAQASSEADKPDPVAAALARVKQAKQAAPAAKQTDSGEWVPDNQEAIAAREARKAQRRAKLAAEDQGPSDEAASSSSNPAVAAAIARAKAKKALSEQEPSASETKPASSSNPAVAAAIARAKAKKAQAEQAAEASAAQEKAAELAEQTPKRPKSAAVSAAIAKAKAKKAEQEQSADVEPKVKPEDTPKKPKSAAVAAAIAKAKAKKAQAEQATSDEQDASESANSGTTTTEAAPKKAKSAAVAAAIAKAKAKKAAEQQRQEKPLDDQ